MIEKAGGRPSVPATDLAPRPGDFPVGSRKSRAAARALAEKRKKPKCPRSFTLDLSSVSIESCQRIHTRCAALPKTHLEEDTPYFVIVFPREFTPKDVEALPDSGEHDSDSDHILPNDRLEVG